MSDKVIGGAPVGSQSLYSPCRFAQIMRGLNMQDRTRCLRPGVQLIGAAESLLFKPAQGWNGGRTPPLGASVVSSPSPQTKPHSAVATDLALSVVFEAGGAEQFE